jgi:hypothetical protein
MKSLFGIFVFEQMCSIKIGQAMGVVWEMGRYPVQNDTNVVLVQ